jgi:hypothetical protein
MLFTIVKGNSPVGPVAVTLQQAPWPPRPNPRRDVEALLAGCLDELSCTGSNESSRRAGNVSAGS